MTALAVPFGDLARESAELKDAYHAAIDRVLRSGRYILGDEVRSFERELAAWLGVKECVGCASGTDALTLALKALGIGAGDEVITAANTCGPTVVGIENAGARARLVDAEPATLMLDARRLAAALTPATRAIVPVHLYGSAADMNAVLAFARRAGLRVVEDCAQSLGSTFSGRKTGTLGDIGAFSFYPSKNLGALGDGGACVTNDSALAERLRQLRHYGQASRYLQVARGLNSRLDELQAALLRVKLPSLESMNRRRQAIAARYAEALGDIPELILPRVADGASSVFHLLVVLHPRRDDLQRFLGGRGIETLIHYPIPVHLQPAYADLGYARGDFPVSEAAAERLLSLPLHPWLSDEQVDRVVAAVRSFAAASRASLSETTAR
jgi:dTDP-3-amino-3,4,6-trideoxy-alpha-D-glucose transaminase